MSNDSPIKALAWMATGAAVLAAGAFLGSAAGRRKERAPKQAAIDPEMLEDLSDRPVARSVLAESLAAARRLEKVAGAVERLELRVQSVERAAPAERIEAIWQKVLQLEQRLEQVQAERAKLPALDTVVAQAETRLSPRIHGLEARVEEHHTAIQQLQTQATQTEANLQKMIAAVEKLAEQIS
ncbi:MAG: hypothetical protein HY238_24215, partial [Acidobacteria bacterium]|nr:hypothetical protein [Acidobacteriota bacterium]